MKTGLRFALSALLLASGVALASESGSDLGSIDFPNSGSPNAQAAFVRGVAALHSFWFEEASEAFQNAQEIDPNFALAYWGEAMSYNHPLWAEQDIASARAVLQRFGATRKERLQKTPTDRERMYMEAVEELYGEGDKLTRDIAYEKAMAKLQARFPDDIEAQAFHALSILGTVRPGEKGFARQVRAGAIALDIFAKHPNHPGAAHYVIHSFDDPEHAPLALPAAERYAQIAPEAHHALHMPSHIFLQLGMWDRVAQSNTASYDASAKWVERKGLSIEKRDYHSLQWRAYANLQRGVWHDSTDAIAIVDRAAKETQSARLERIRASMQATEMIETGRYENLPLPESDLDTSRYSSSANTILALGMGAAEAKDAAKTEKAAELVAKLREGTKDKYAADSYSIMEQELLGLASMARGETDQALNHLAEATKIEDTQDPPSGPVYPLKPSHELYGELLAKAGRYPEAIAQFQTSMSRTPNRTATLLGLARASMKVGDTETATASYEKLQGFLKDADADVPFLAEVRGFHASTEDR
jgi:tetratricopeptide (TPR) repeat protein